MDWFPVFLQIFGRAIIWCTCETVPVNFKNSAAYQVVTQTKDSIQSMLMFISFEKTNQKACVKALDYSSILDF